MKNLRKTNKKNRHTINMRLRRKKKGKSLHRQKNKTRHVALGGTNNPGYMAETSATSGRRTPISTPATRKRQARKVGTDAAAAVQQVQRNITTARRVAAAATDAAARAQAGEVPAISSHPPSSLSPPSNPSSPSSSPSSPLLSSSLNSSSSFNSSGLGSSPQHSSQAEEDRVLIAQYDALQHNFSFENDLNDTDFGGENFKEITVQYRVKNDALQLKTTDDGNEIKQSIKLKSDDYEPVLNL